MNVNQELKKRTLHRAKIIRGQLDGLVNALENETYCTDLLEQSLSIQKSIKSLDTFILENHLRTHVKHQMQNRNECDRAINELIKVYTLSNR